MRRSGLAMLAMCVAAAGSAGADLPVREVTVFKDGHAMLVHEGTVELGEGGVVTVADLPVPVLASFLPYAEGDGLVVDRVRKRRVEREEARRPESLAEALAASVGEEVRVRLREGAPNDWLQGRLLHLTPAQDGPRPLHQMPAPRVADPFNPFPASGTLSSPAIFPPSHERVLMLEMPDGVRTLELSAISEVYNLGEAPEYASTKSAEEYEFTVASTSGGDLPAEARVGYMYIQRGIRWIPSYRLVQRGDGAAELTLQATIINEIADLEDVRARLAVGVPRIALEGTRDPMASGATPTLSEFFPPLGPGANADTRSRALLSQMAFSNAMPSGGGMESPAPGAPMESDANAELYFFDVENLTLGKGESIVVQLASIEVELEDIYRFQAPLFAGLPDRNSSGYLRQGYDGSDASDRDALNAPRVQHLLQWENGESFPLTTAPVMVMDTAGRLLTQSNLRYTAPGAKAEVELNPVLNVVASTEERQIESTPNAARVNDLDLMKITMGGTITLANRRSEPTTIEVRRDVMGKILAQKPEGETAPASLSDIRNQIEDSSMGNWRHNLPDWLAAFNGFDRATWTVTIKPGEELELETVWEYHWRP